MNPGMVREKKSGNEEGKMGLKDFGRGDIEGDQSVSTKSKGKIKSSPFPLEEESKEEIVNELGREDNEVHYENKTNTVPTESPSKSQSSTDPIKSLFAERASRFLHTEALVRQAEIETKKAADRAEQDRLRAKRERMERLAREKREDDLREKERSKGRDSVRERGDIDRKLYEEKVRAEAVVEAERKKREDRKEKDRILKAIRDDRERMALRRRV